MILKTIRYYEFKGQDNYWEIKDVVFSKQNIIAGLNATGKTRLINVISGFAKLLSSKIKVTGGNWFLTFENGNNIKYSYILQINEGIIDCEEIKENEAILLLREKENGRIYSKKDNKYHTFNPPGDELTLNVRRDVAEYPFLEEFIKWAKNLHGYLFSGVKNDQITIPNKPEGYLETLTTVPYILQQAGSDKGIVEKILADMHSIGYPVDKIFVKSKMLQPQLHHIFTIVVQESDLNCETEQTTISNGMFRALCLVVILEYLIKTGSSGTLIIDDLGEGLDFDRSAKLTRLLFEKTKNIDFQIIITSNDRFLINNVDMKNINFLERDGHVVVASNYENNKEVFDTFMLSGLNNFDYLNPGLSYLKN